MSSYRNSGARLPIMEGAPPNLIPPRMEWDRPPWNRWSFQHIREILPTAEVWRGAGPVSAFAERPMDLGPEAEAVLDRTYTDGFLVHHDGAIVSERYFNGMDRRTLHLSQSVAKSVTGTVAGILAGRGVIDPAALVTRYIPELEDTAWRGATLAQVLDMTTGVSFSEEYTDPTSDIGQVDVASGWKPPPPDADPAFRWPGHMFELMRGLTRLERPHGEGFVYRSIETDVLGLVMERATGKRLPLIVSEELWQKIGAEESASFTVDPAGTAIADGGFNATLRDYARFGLLWLNGGGGIIPPDWIAATRRGVHGRFDGRYAQTLPEGAYRNQFWIEDPSGEALVARGVFGQMIYINWRYRMVAVKLSSWPDFVDPVLERDTLAFLHGVGRRLTA